jgi:four helix bundle protein
MGYVKSYRELLVWRKADELAVRVYKISSKFPKDYLFDLTNQLRRATLSIPTNLAEGCASDHTVELLQFINISNRSLSETKYLLEFAHKMDLIKSEEMSNLDCACLEISKMLSSLALSIKKRKADSRSN